MSPIAQATSWPADGDISVVATTERRLAVSRNTVARPDAPGRVGRRASILEPAPAIAGSQRAASTICAEILVSCCWSASWSAFILPSCML